MILGYACRSLLKLGFKIASSFSEVSGEQNYCLVNTLDDREYRALRARRMLALAQLQISLVNRSPSGCGDVLHRRGHWHHFVLCVFGAGVPKILFFR